MLDRKEALSQSERRLAAIMSTDIVGYTALGQENESLSLETLEKHRSLLRPIFSKHGGREVKTIVPQGPQARARHS
jgi:class 3 adenylate cyclase